MRLYFGWYLTLGLALTSTVGYGVYYYAFGVFLGPMETETGWGRAESSLALSLGLLAAGLAAYPVGAWVDRRGARGLMTAGSLLGAASAWAWAQAGSLGMLYAAFAGMGIAMAATTYEVSFNVVAVWFRRERRRAMVLITLFGALASTVFVPLCTYLNQVSGWRGGVEALALLILLVTLPVHALLVRRSPAAQGLLPDGGALPGSAESAGSPGPGERAEALRPLGRTLAGRPFRALALAFTCARVAQMALTAHMILMLGERGLGPGLVAAAVGSIGVMQLLGRVLFAGLERLPPIRVTVLGFGLQASACLALLALPGQAGLWAFVGLLGLTNGALTLARPVLLAETFGAAQYGRVSGGMSLIGAVTQTLGPVGAGLLHDATGDYSAVLLASALAFGLSAVAANGALGGSRPSGPA